MSKSPKKPVQKPLKAAVKKAGPKPASKAKAPAKPEASAKTKASPKIKASAKPKSASKKTPAKKTAVKKLPRNNERVPMVGIGASAGGLEPFERFFDAMPVKSGIAFVVIQHLSPDFESMMDQLLSRHSSMNIERVVDNLRVKPNTIYLNPPRSHMVVKNGKFVLTEHPDPKKLNLPIDIFFESMAQEYGQKAIAIVLSGTGSDGTRGVAAIREFEGTVLVQSPASAKFDGMPRSVIESSNFDAIATPSEMPELIALVRKGMSIDQAYSGEMTDDPAKHIFYRLRDKFGTDFGYYKDATIRRRFERRAQLSGLELEGYAKRLETDADELDALYADLLIDVTSFFRDLKAFHSVRTLAIDKLAQKMTHDNQIRVWVAGCSSGEEAYSIAIAFAEYARENNIPLNLKILATDVHQRSLGAAAEGIYPKSSLKGLGDDQIARYFEKNVDYYQINQRMRRLVVFSKHNLLRDPPFTRIDMVTCRNVLIYFREEAQQKTLALFHFALRIGGYLFLGPSETLGRLDEEFEQLDRRWKIFQKLRDVRLIEATSLLPRDSSKHNKKDFQVPFLTGRTGTLQRFQQAHGDALEVMLKKYAPPGFLINKNGEVAHVFGNAGKFVKVDGGSFSNRIIDLVDPQLRLAITAGFERVMTGERNIFERKVIVAGEEGEPNQSVVVTLSTLSDIGGGNGHYLLTLVSSLSRVEPFSDDVKFLDTSESSQILQSRIRDLERDLTSTEESLQSLVEELQTSNEELQATNEELMASNEELQSTNEELHSVNEELYTVSAEHQSKIDELTVLTDDMNLLLKATNIGIIFLDELLNIRRFTPSATQAFNLLDQDIGRPFAHTTYRFEDHNLLELIEEVRNTGTASLHEITVGDNDYIMGVLPYETSLRETAGIVITLVDMTVIKKADRERIAQKEIFETVLNDIHDPIFRMDVKDGTIVMCNDAFAGVYGKTQEEVTGETLGNIAPKFIADQTFAEVKGAKPGEIIDSQIVIREKKRVKSIFSRNIRIIGDAAGQASVAQITGKDITEEYFYTQALESMINIEVESGGDTKKSLQLIIETGCKYLDLDVGIVAKIVDEKYITENVHSAEDSALKVGDEIPYEETICCFLPKGPFTVSIPDMSKSRFKDELCYEAGGSETFIGTRTEMLGESYGAVSFSSSKPRGRAFSDMDKTIVRLLGRMIGFLLDRDSYFKNLIERQKELENVNEGLNRFTYLASHDLQEPLRKIQQSGELLQADFNGLLDEEGSYFLRIMTDAASRMRSLIDDLLLYSTSANEELDKENVALTTLVDMAVEEVKPLMDEHGAEMKIGKLPMISCDAKVMRQVLVNIFGNSLKYRKEDTLPVIEIKSRRKKRTTVISFIDNGIGMDVEENVNVFDPFVRLHARSEYQGSGIGLAICKSVCDRHGWGIGYKSKVGQGTEIYIEIPNRDIS